MYLNPDFKVFARGLLTFLLHEKPSFRRILR